MILILFTHLLIFFLCLMTGLLIQNIILINTKKEQVGKHITIHIINGLIGLTTLIQILDLFLPINLYAALILSIPYVIIIICKRKTSALLINSIVHQFKNLNLFSRIGFLSLLFLLILINSGPTLMDDTESYHIQMVKWIQEFGTVPGIANLHERFGFNSSWFSSIAFFTLPTQYNFYTTLNGILSIVFGLYLWSQVDVFKNKNIFHQNKFSTFSSLFILLLGVFLWPLLRGNASTANYDFITSALIVIFFIELFKIDYNPSSNKLTYEIILWPVYLFTVRIINYPLLILTIFGLYRLLNQKQYISIFVSSAVSILIILPFLTRNTILSGYPFYPSPFINVFNVDWKVESTVIDDLLRFIKYFNRINNMFQSIETTAAISFPTWILEWFKHLFTYDKILVSLGFIGFALAPLVLRKNLFKNRVRLIFFITLVFQLCSWLIVAPDPRFVYGCLLCGASLSFLILTKWTDLNTSRNIVYMISFILIFFSLTLLLYKPISDLRYRNIFFPYELPQPQTKEFLIDGVEFKIPERVLNNWNPRCYALDVPCLYKVDPDLHLRGKSLKKGFSKKKIQSSKFESE